MTCPAFWKVSCNLIVRAAGDGPGQADEHKPGPRAGQEHRMSGRPARRRLAATPTSRSLARNGLQPVRRTVVDDGQEQAGRLARMQARPERRPEHEDVPDRDVSDDGARGVRRVVELQCRGIVARLAAGQDRNQHRGRHDHQPTRQRASPAAPDHGILPRRENVRQTSESVATGRVEALRRPGRVSAVAGIWRRGGVSR